MRALGVHGYQLDRHLLRLEDRGIPGKGVSGSWPRCASVFALMPTAAGPWSTASTMGCVLGWAFLTALIVACVGFLGVVAFNPDEGSVLRSEVLWNVFGFGLYAGFAALVVIPLLAAGHALFVLAARRVGRCREPR